MIGIEVTDNIKDSKKARPKNFWGKDQTEFVGLFIRSYITVRSCVDCKDIDEQPFAPKSFVNWDRWRAKHGFENQDISVLIDEYQERVDGIRQNRTESQAALKYAEFLDMMISKMKQAQLIDNARKRKLMLWVTGSMMSLVLKATEKRFKLFSPMLYSLWIDNGAPGKNLPARPFLGIDGKVYDQIFDEYIAPVVNSKYLSFIDKYLLEPENGREITDEDIARLEEEAKNILYTNKMKLKFNQMMGWKQLKVPSRG